MYILFDTETIGTPRKYDLPASDLANWATARMVQIAWIEYDEHGNKVASHDYLIKPDGFTIPLEAIKIHRITNERANERGLPVKKVLAMFREALARNKYLVAHNVQFDQNVVGSEFIRAGQDDPLEGIFKVCTMKLTTNFVKARSPWGAGKYKWPTLSELHMKLFGTEFKDAHDALVDTEALGRCFFKLQEMGILGFKEAAQNNSMFSGAKSADLPAEELFKPMVNFGLHTFFSILRGASSSEQYVKRAKDLGHTAIVLTDRGNLSGSLDFYQRCKAEGLKPIIGCELNVNDNIGKYEDKSEEGSSYVQKIIVKNKLGYINLNKLLFLSHTDGFLNGESRISTDWLIKNKEGLMVSTSGHEGYVADLVVRGRREDAEAYILKLKAAFGDDLFVEVKFNELQEQKTLNEFLLSMALKHKLKVIVDNDVHYASPDGNELQDTVYTIGQHGASLKKGKLFDRRSLFYASRKNFMDFNKKFGYFYPEKVIEAFMDNTIELADRCSFDFEFGVEKYPKYEPTQDVIDYFKTDSPEEIIYKMASAKLKKKLKERERRTSVVVSEEEREKYFNRLSFELDIIKSKNMLDYFMINWEILRDYRSKGFEVGSGRGSAAGSLLSWVLDITKIDPIKYGLYFERFLNPTRNCLTDDAVVLMKDGSLKPIVDVVAGDEVETESGRGELVQVHEREVTDEDEVFELELENGAMLRLTSDHVMPVMRNGKRVDVAVADLQEGDEMLTE